MLGRNSVEMGELREQKWQRRYFPCICGRNDLNGDTCVEGRKERRQKEGINTYFSKYGVGAIDVVVKKQHHSIACWGDVVFDHTMLCATSFSEASYDKRVGNC